MPDLVKAAIDVQRFGANGITIHPRPDERHIRYQDVYDLKKVITTEYNIEGYPSMDFMKLVDDVRPEQVTLVPDPPGVLTSNAGWDMISNASFLKEVVSYFKSIQCRVSLFVDPSPMMVEAASYTGTDRIELYTEAYASGFAEDPSEAVRSYIEAAQKASEVGLGINAGHDLNLENLAYFRRMVPNLLEVSIGHALISDALYFGLEETVRMYKEQLQ